MPEVPGAVQGVLVTASEPAAAQIAAGVEIRHDGLGARPMTAISPAIRNPVIGLVCRLIPTDPAYHEKKLATCSS